MRTNRAALYAVALATLIAGCQDSAPPPGPDGPDFGVTSSTTQYHFVANGQFGYVNWYQYDTLGSWFTYGTVNASRGGTTGNPQTWMEYYVVQCDWYSCYYLEAGYGLIPNRDLSGGGGRLHLSTNTDGNPNFYVWAGSGGQLSVDWQSNGLYSSSWSGTTQYDYAAACDSVACYSGYKHRSQGKSTNTSASASGSVVGVALPLTGDAWIGTNRQVTIDIYR